MSEATKPHYTRTENNPSKKSGRLKPNENSPTPYQIAKIAAILSVQHPEKPASKNAFPKTASGKTELDLSAAHILTRQALRLWRAAELQLADASAQMARLKAGVFKIPKGEWESLFKSFTNTHGHAFTDVHGEVEILMEREDVLRGLFSAKSETKNSRQKKFVQLWSSIAVESVTGTNWRRNWIFKAAIPGVEQEVDQRFDIQAVRQLALARQSQLRDAKTRRSGCKSV